MMEIDEPIWERSLPFLLFYFAPVFVGAYRRWKKPGASWPAWGLFLVVFFTGWTVIGWLFALRMAFRDKEVPWQWLGSSSVSGSRSGAWQPTAAPDSWSAATADSPKERQRCTCNNGRHYCQSCGGQGWVYEERGSVTCSSCLGQGSTTCSGCGGSGYLG